MDSELITMVYTHNHECARKGQEFVYTPPCRNGVVLMPTLICIESDAKLEFVTSRKT